MSSISRRSFVGTAAAGAALAGMAVAAPAFADEIESWDYECDFVVVGAGTGMGGAVASAVAGMDTILLESRSTVGGAMALSGGCAWMPNTAFSQATGDSYETALTYLKHMQQGYKNEEVMYAFLENTQNTVDTLAAGGVNLQPMPYGIEYHTDWEGAWPAGGRSMMIPTEDGGTTKTVGGGWRLSDALETACDNLGVRTMTNTKGQRLVTKRASSDAVPEVVGIIAEQDGAQITIKANKGILLATGGFEWDEELVTNYVRIPCRYFVSWPTNDGAGLRMVQSVGAELAMMNEFWGQTVYTAHGEYSKEHGEPCALACQTERSVPGAILVDANGRRFCNEASDYDSQGNTMGGYNNWGDNGWTCDPCWLVYDNVCYETYGVVGRGQDSGFPVPDIAEEDMIIVADTLEELAEKIGVPAEMLVRTVDEFNLFAEQGRDPIFHRGETFRPLSRVTETLAPLTEAPYRAISVSPGCLGTIGGPRLNANAQVLHVYGEPIKGLYAMGNCAGVGSPGPTYGGAGGTIGPAFVMGVIAAQHAAAREE